MNLSNHLKFISLYKLLDIFGITQISNKNFSLTQWRQLGKKTEIYSHLYSKKISQLIWHNVLSVYFKNKQILTLNINSYIKNS